MDQMHYKSATELALLIRRKKVSALERAPDRALARERAIGAKELVRQGAEAREGS